MRRSILPGAVALVLLTAPLEALQASPINGTYTANTLPASDDGFAGPVALGFSFTLFGNSYSSVYVNSNGNVSLLAPQGSLPASGLATAGGNPLIAPFLADIYTLGFGSGLVTYEARASGIGGRPTFGVEWPGVNYFADDTGDKRNTFELLIVGRDDLGAGSADIYFNYGSIQWESGDLSGGTDGLGGTCAEAGIADGNGMTLLLPGSGTCAALIDGGTNALASNTNNGLAGQFLFALRTATDVPEPASAVMLAAGLLGLAARRRA